MDIEHIQATIERFHKTTNLLACLATGMKEEELIAYPAVIKKGKRLGLLRIGFPEGDTDYIAPYIVNGAFSLELILKLINYIEFGKWETHHDLYGLYSSISEESKSVMSEEFRKLASTETHKTISKVLNEEAKVQFSWNLEKVIKMSAKAFEGWRYAFEKKENISCFVGYGEIRAVCLNRIKSLGH